MHFFVHFHNAHYCQSDNLQYFSKLGISYTDTEWDIQGSREIVKMHCTCINPCLFPTHPVAIQYPNANRDSVWHISTFCALIRKAFLRNAQKIELCCLALVQNLNRCLVLNWSYRRGWKIRESYVIHVDTADQWPVLPVRRQPSVVYIHLFYPCCNFYKL